MSTQHTPTQRETEYSKAWAQANPALFAANILEFIEQHPSPHWRFSMTTTKGFFTLRATLNNTGGAA